MEIAVWLLWFVTGCWCFRVIQLILWRIDRHFTEVEARRDITFNNIVNGTAKQGEDKCDAQSG